MKEQKVIVIVGSNHSEIKAESEPYDEDEHLLAVLESPGCLSASRYQVIKPGWDVMGPEGGREGANVNGFPTYLQVYEFENQEALEQYEKRRQSPEWIAGLVKKWGKDPHYATPEKSQIKGPTVQWRVQYKMLVSRRKKK